MKRIQDLVGRELQWTQPRAMKREFELRDGDEQVATLHFRSGFGSLATATVEQGSWTFKRVGFWKPRVTVRAGGSETEIAVFENNTWSAGGTLHMADQRSFRASTNFWMTSYQFQGDDDQPLVRFQKVGGMFHLSCKVEIESAAARIEELPWMVALGWYLAIKMHDDASGATAGAAAG